MSITLTNRKLEDTGTWAWSWSGLLIWNTVIWAQGKNGHHLLASLSSFLVLLMLQIAGLHSIFYFPFMYHLCFKVISFLYFFVYLPCACFALTGTRKEKKKKKRCYLLSATRCILIEDDSWKLQIKCWNDIESCSFLSHKIHERITKSWCCSLEPIRAVNCRDWLLFSSSRTFHLIQVNITPYQLNFNMVKH